MESLKNSLSPICDVNNGVMQLFIELLAKKGYTSRPFLGERDAKIYENLTKVNKRSMYYAPTTFVVLENATSKGIVMMENDGVTFRAWNYDSDKICFSVKAGNPYSNSDSLKSLLVRYVSDNGTVFDERSTVRSDSSIDWISFVQYSSDTILEAMQANPELNPCELTYNLMVLPPSSESIIPSKQLPNGVISPDALINPGVLSSYAKYSVCLMTGNNKPANGFGKK